MFALLHLLFALVFDRFKSRRRLEIENLYLRHQLNIAMRRAPQRFRLRGADRAFKVWMTRLWPGLLSLSRVVRPDTIMRWHRAGFRAFWRWKSSGPCPAQHSHLVPLSALQSCPGYTTTTLGHHFRETQVSDHLEC